MSSKRVAAKSSVPAEFVELTLHNGLHVLLVQKDIIQAWETDVQGEVLLRVVEHSEEYVRVLYPWAKIKDLLPATDHRKRPSKANPPLKQVAKKR